MTLERKETQRGHTYRLDGKPVPGVTTLLGKGLPKPALVNWAARTVAEYAADNWNTLTEVRDQGREELVDLLKGAHYRDRDRAATRGTDVHALAEQLIHGQEVEVPEHLTGYVEGYARWLDLWQVEPIVTEKPCANREWWYAGTFDAIVTINAGQFKGARFLLDWKTSKGVYGETALQLAAYRHAEFYIDNGEQPMPQVDALGVVHVQADGSDLYVVNNPDDAWKQWQHVSWVAKQVNLIRDQITEPTFKE